MARKIKKKNFFIHYIFIISHQFTFTFLVVIMRSKFSYWINMRCVDEWKKNLTKNPFYFSYIRNVLCHVCIHIVATNGVGKYCKPSFIRMRVIFARLARVSSSRIFLSANQSLSFGWYDNTGLIRLGREHKLPETSLAEVNREIK